MTEINEKLNEVRLEITRTKAQKACQYAWLRHFMENESEFEHEAFLSLWLSRFVFPKKSFNIIVRCVFPIAIHLARGKRIALAPAVLASIYRDLSLLKKAIVGSTKLNAGDDEDDVLAVAIWSPLQLVQIWAWERFVTLRSKPNLLQNGEPRFAQWNKLKMLKGENVRLALDSAGECFQWRPYTSMVNNGLFHKFYGEKEDWVSIDHDSDSDLVSFARCLRAS
ncbi:hypothetical protein L1049_001468 [Liquidambar formosana]|uniref:Aminotransferase-like plant mobile domain-containing protein n=1 Tax=Liquidambar formosana TaxID=63359 RepID=A0AAP0NDC4_LIQFO